MAGGITEALKSLADNADDYSRSEWNGQLRLLGALGADLAHLQAAWSEATPPTIRRAVHGVKPVPISHLLAQLGKGGPMWPHQIARGFDVVVAFSQDGLFPVGREYRAALGGANRTGRAYPIASRHEQLIPGPKEQLNSGR